MPTIEFTDVTVTFPGTRRRPDVMAVQDFSLAIRDEEFVCLLGPSGCGKSTLLNVLAGFLPKAEGSVTVDGAPIGPPGPSRGVVFQDANVFPWLTVRDNIAFGPKSQGRTGPEIDAKINDLIRRVKLDGFEHSLPVELSGGMRQRVGIARTLVNDPPVLLMDEPFGALDAQTRITMQELLLELWERDRKTVLFVTHDIDEALLLADRVVIMTNRPGRIKHVMDVPLARPRHYEVSSSEEFRKLRSDLFTILRSEIETTPSVA